MSVKEFDRNQYNKETYTKLCFRFNKLKQSDVIEHIRKQPSSAGYIAQLVREDIAKHNHDNNGN